MASRSPTKPQRTDPGADTRERVLTAAFHVFAERGFDGATLRQITELAPANIASVNYYFRSKDELIRQVMHVYVRPIVEARLAALDFCLQAAGSEPPRLEAVVEALVLPMIRLSHDHRGGRALVRLLLQTRALPREATLSFVHETFDEAAHRFVDAFCRALPHMTREEVFWRYDFALGAIMQVLTDSDPVLHRLAGLSGGLCDTENDAAIAAHLIPFVVAGFRAETLHSVPSPPETSAAPL